MHRMRQARTWIALGLAVSMLLHPLAVRAAGPPRACPTGTCIPSRRTFGYYPPVWRKWPAPTPAAAAPQGPPVTAPKVELPAPEAEGESSTSAQRPETAAPQPQPPESQSPQDQGSGAAPPSLPRTGIHGQDPAPFPPKDPGDMAPNLPGLSPAPRAPAAPPGELPSPKPSEPTLDELFPGGPPPSAPPTAGGAASGAPAASGSTAPKPGDPGLPALDPKSEEDPAPSLDDIFNAVPQGASAPAGLPAQKAGTQAASKAEHTLMPAQDAAPQPERQRPEPLPSPGAKKPDLDEPPALDQLFPDAEQGGAAGAPKNPLVQAILPETKTARPGDTVGRYFANPFAPRRGKSPGANADDALQLPSANPLRASHTVLSDEEPAKNQNASPMPEPADKSDEPDKLAETPSTDAEQTAPMANAEPEAAATQDVSAPDEEVPSGENEPRRVPQAEDAAPLSAQLKRRPMRDSAPAVRTPLSLVKFDGQTPGDIQRVEANPLRGDRKVADPLPQGRQGSMSIYNRLRSELPGPPSQVSRPQPTTSAQPRPGHANPLRAGL